MHNIDTHSPAVECQGMSMSVTFIVAMLRGGEREERCIGIIGPEDDGPHCARNGLEGRSVVGVENARGREWGGSNGDVGCAVYCWVSICDKGGREGQGKGRVRTDDPEELEEGDESDC